MNRPVCVIHVRSLCPAQQDGLLVAGNLRIPCKLGRAGRRAMKREGDGATPSGLWPMRRILARCDSWGWVRSGLPFRFTAPDDGWCDDPADGNYNRLVKLPSRRSAEGLKRDDPLYDLVLVLGYNDRPRVRGRGSAIFVHLARPGFTPTDGCIALSRRDLTRLLAVLSPRSAIVVG